MRVNCALALLATFFDLFRFASSVYRIFPFEPLKEDGRSLQDVTTQCRKQTGGVTVILFLYLDCRRLILTKYQEELHYIATYVKWKLKIVYITDAYL